MTTFLRSRNSASEHRLTIELVGQSECFLLPPRLFVSSCSSPRRLLLNDGICTTTPVEQNGMAVRLSPVSSNGQAVADGWGGGRKSECFCRFQRRSTMSTIDNRQSTTLVSATAVSSVVAARRCESAEKEALRWQDRHTHENSKHWRLCLTKMTSHHASLFANCSIGMLFSWR
jgi:hypothetical protein